MLLFWFDIVALKKRFLYIRLYTPIAAEGFAVWTHLEFYYLTKLRDFFVVYWVFWGKALQFSARENTVSGPLV